LVKRTDDAIELRTLTAQCLGTCRIVPDFRVLQFAAYFFQAVFVAGIVKDTP